MITIQGYDYDRITYDKYNTVLERTILDFLLKIEDGIFKGEKEYSNLKNSVNRNPYCAKINASSDLHFISDSAFSGSIQNNPLNLNSLLFDGIIGIIHDPCFSTDGKNYDIAVKIRTRFDKNKSHSYFLAEMIRNYVKQYLGLTLAENEIPLEEEDLFEFLKIYIFRKNLLAAYDAGFYKKYTYFQKNDFRLKGRIDIARHIRLNGGFDNGKIAYEYRESTVDNAVNHLILITWMELLKEYPNMASAILSRENQMGISAEKILCQLQYLAPGFHGKSLQNILYESTIPVTSLFFSEYENLRKSCIEILKGLNLSVYTGASELKDTVQSMLFYVPDLWEVYVRQILKELCNEQNWNTLDTQKEIKVLHSLMKGTPRQSSLGKIYPDFILSDEDSIKLVLDAKFKPKWESYVNNYISIKDDIRQVLTYGELTQSEKIGVIFPTNARNTFLDAWKVGNRKDNLQFLVCGLKIPDTSNKSYKQWSEEMRDNTLDLKRLLIEAINCS